VPDFYPEYGDSTKIQNYIYIYSTTKLHGDSSWNKIASRTCKQAITNCHVAGPKKELCESERKLAALILV
jgi:hypothetical protein